MSRTLRITTVSLCLTLLVACGDSGSTSGSPSSSTAVETSAAAADTQSATAATAVDGVVEVLATGGLKFVPGELTARVGVPFKGRLVQKGAIPHNIEIKEFGVKGDDTTTLEAGDAKAFGFTPTKAGTFPFVCTFHAAQMKGTLTVT